MASTDLRAAAQQALEALDKSLYMNDYCGLEVSKHDQPDVTDAIEALRAALAEPVQEPSKRKLVPTEPTIGMCIAGDEARQNVDDLTRTPAIYRAMIAAAPALPQQAEPVQEPAQAISECLAVLRPMVQGRFPHEQALEELVSYTAPPQRKPLTEEEILKAVGWDRAEMYMKLTPNFPVAEAKKETLKNARAIERAHGIKERT